MTLNPLGQHADVRGMDTRWTSGETVKVTSGHLRGAEGTVLLPTGIGVEIVVDQRRHWVFADELEKIVTV